MQIAGRRTRAAPFQGVTVSPLFNLSPSPQSSVAASHYPTAALFYFRPQDPETSKVRVNCVTEINPAPILPCFSQCTVVSACRGEQSRSAGPNRPSRCGRSASLSLRSKIGAGVGERSTRPSGRGLARYGLNFWLTTAIVEVFCDQGKSGTTHRRAGRRP